MPCVDVIVHGPTEEKPPEEGPGLVQTLKENPVLVAAGIGAGAIALSKREEQ